MKIIHTGDIHLNSPLDSSFTAQKAKIRNNEIMNTFKKTVEFAKDNGIKVVIIAGDLFDCNDISRKTEQFVFDVVSSNSDIDFLYLLGNHDDNVKYNAKLPDNLIILKDGEKHFYDNVCVCGIESYNNIDFAADNYNIAVMHGEISNGYGKYEVNLKELQNKNIDYLALGHIHKGGNGKIDDKGVYFYCGVLDSRGYGEYDKHGFILVDTDSKKYDFVCMSSRIARKIELDITDLKSNLEIVNAIEEKVKNIEESSIVKVVLTGGFDEDLLKDIKYIEQNFEDRFFNFKVEDNSVIKINFDSYKNDISLKGEFVRQVQNGEYSDEMLNKILIAGFDALNNEEISIWKYKSVILKISEI